MSAARRKHPQNRRRNPPKPKPFDLWQPAPEMAEPAPIAPPSDVTVLLRSLGDPPLPGQGAVAQRYMAAVTERAASLAAALAASADLLASPEEE
jgi:hypothetical protein